ncbi:MAG TPA: thioesterase family protein, partial [Brevibacterium sp.]|nr:thioesterase family protein [Brevibacterium sp.]
MQHGGPPAALLARAVEQIREDEAMSIGRLTIDMLGPIPQGRIRTEATIVRPGKRIELVEAKLWAEDRLAVTATAWRMRSTPESSAEVAASFDTSSVPEPQDQKYFPGISPDWGYGRAIEWRFVSGGLQELGAADVWVRPRIPLVAGEDTSPIQRFVIVADSA